jgi:hypothetical protein
MGIFDHDVFKHIISIGYEFETHDISKISMTNNDFIVSNISMQGLKDRVQSGDAVKSGNHLYSFYNYRTEYIDDPDMDGDDVNPDIMMHTTVDFGESHFDTSLLPHCIGLQDKNKMYALKLKKTYPITFPGSLADLTEFPCSNFTGVEWIVTYYKPPSSSSIILNTYIDACSRISEQLDQCEKQTGSFIIRSTKEVVGYKHRHVYHKPGTNLFFLQRNDGIDTRTGRNTFSLNAITIVPQMTFCANVSHAMQIMCQMITLQPLKQTSMTKSLKKIQDEFVAVYECTASLFPHKNAIVQKCICLLSLILYKVVTYVNNFSVGTVGPDDYFKDVLTFSVRHSNAVLYKRLKELLEETHLSMDIVQLDAIEKLYKHSVTAVKFPSQPEGFGDPTVSFRSYFDYMDQKGTDWLEDTGIVKFSAMYEFKHDNLMIEHREFGPTIATMMKDRNINVVGYAPTLKMITSLNETILADKHAVDLRDKVYDKHTGQYTKKCKRGESRIKGVCTRKNIGLSYFKFSCDEEHRELLEYLVSHARKQASNFKTVFPWEHECNENYYVYVALQLPPNETLQSMLQHKVEPVIYGWMNVELSIWKTYRIAYVNHVTARTDKTVFKNIGSILIERMEQQMIEGGIDFIKLLPIGSAVGFYKKIGYTACLEDGPDSLGYMCKTLRRDPPSEYAKYVNATWKKEKAAHTAELKLTMKEIKKHLSKAEKKIMDEKLEEDETFIEQMVYLFMENGIDEVKNALKT